MNRAGACATITMNRMSRPEMMNSGFLRRVRHASAHAGGRCVLVDLESTSCNGVSSEGDVTVLTGKGSHKYHISLVGARFSFALSQA